MKNASYFNNSTKKRYKNTKKIKLPKVLKFLKFVLKDKVKFKAELDKLILKMGVFLNKTVIIIEQ